MRRSIAYVVADHDEHVAVDGDEPVTRKVEPLVRNRWPLGCFHRGAAPNGAPVGCLPNKPPSLIVRGVSKNASARPHGRFRGTFTHRRRYLFRDALCQTRP